MVKNSDGRTSHGNLSQKKKKLHNPAWPLVHNAEDIWHTKRWTQGEGSRECCLRLLDEWGAPLAGSAFREEFKRFAIESDLVWLAQMARQYEVFCWGGGWLLKNNLKTPRPRQRCWRASLSWWSIGQDKAAEPPTLPKKKLHNPAWPLVHNAEDIWHTKRWTQGEGWTESCPRLLDEEGTAPMAGSALENNARDFISSLIWSDLPRWPDKFKFFIVGVVGSWRQSWLDASQDKDLKGQLSQKKTWQSNLTSSQHRRQMAHQDMNTGRRLKRMLSKTSWWMVRACGR